MESLSISHSSLRIPAVIPRRCMTSFHDNTFITIKPPARNTKSFNFPSRFCCTSNSILQVGLHGESRFPKSLTYGRYKRNFFRASAQFQSTGSDPVLVKEEDESPGPDSVLAKVSHFVITSYNFSRPVSILQVIIANICLFASVLVENPQLFTLSVLLKAFPGLLAMIFANAYYAGINQIYDVDIDKVNKPYLPIAAGDLSIKQAWYLVIFYVLAGVLILWLMNADKITTLLYYFGIFLATFYSAPPFRFKISSLATAVVLPLNAGFIQILGILYTTRVSLGLPFLWSPKIVFFLSFVPVFYLVISFVKDIIDVEGDMKYNIRTFAAIFGPRITIFLGTGILLVNYIRAIALAIYMPQAFKLHIMVPAHSLLALWLIFEAKMAEKANYTKVASAMFYKTVWKLLILEFFLFPFI